MKEVVVYKQSIWELLRKRENEIGHGIKREKGLNRREGVRYNSIKRYDIGIEKDGKSAIEIDGDSLQEREKISQVRWKRNLSRE